MLVFVCRGVADRGPSEGSTVRAAVLPRTGSKTGRALRFKLEKQQ